MTDGTYMRTQGCLPQSSRPVGCLSLQRALYTVQLTGGSCRVCVSFNTAAVLPFFAGTMQRCTSTRQVCTKIPRIDDETAGNYASSVKVRTCPNVVVRLRLCQARIIKEMAGSPR